MCFIMGRSLAVWSNILFLLDQVLFELTPSAQIWPRNLNTQAGGTAGSIYLIVSDIGTKSGFGMDYVFGQVFLERFYSVYDSAHSRVGLARTIYTNASTNPAAAVTATATDASTNPTAAATAISTRRGGFGRVGVMVAVLVVIGRVERAGGWSFAVLVVGLVGCSYLFCST
jgi:Eukaryotic aspartyl protease